MTFHYTTTIRPSAVRLLGLQYSFLWPAAILSFHSRPCGHPFSHSRPCGHPPWPWPPSLAAMAALYIVLCVSVHMYHVVDSFISQHSFMHMLHIFTCIYTCSYTHMLIVFPRVYILMYTRPCGIIAHFICDYFIFPFPCPFSTFTLHSTASALRVNSIN